MREALTNCQHSISSWKAGFTFAFTPAMVQTPAAISLDSRNYEGNDSTVTGSGVGLG